MKFDTLIATIDRFQHCDSLREREKENKKPAGRPGLTPESVFYYW
jgi:hypothetical protein